MTPTERLIAAADLLDKRAGEATEGPWRARTWEDDGDSFADVVGKSEAEQYSGSYTVTTALVTGGPTEVTEPGWLAPINARYIATMHPEVGKALAEYLRGAGHRLASRDLDFQAVAADKGVLFDAYYGHALALSDLILAGAS